MSLLNVKLNKFEILSLFKNNILKFLDALIELFPDEPDMIVLRLMFENQIPVEESMCLLNKRIMSSKDMIKGRNDIFFLSNNDIFYGLKQDKINRWKNLWKSSRLDKEDRKAIWDWMDVFLSIAEMYEENKNLDKRED